MGQVIYKGTRAEDGSPQVTKQIDDQPPQELNLRRDLARHSTYLDWGYPGREAPMQLSLAILGDVLWDADAIKRAELFKEEVIATLPHEGFSISANAVEQWAKFVENSGKA